MTKAQKPGIDRARTAIRRHACSRPLATALADGVVRRGLTVLDYGCGHGHDLEHLKRLKVPASGWDPNHRAHGRLQHKDVVLISYVLNVIEDPSERAETLKRAFSFARSSLVVAVRVDSLPEGQQEYADGFLTSAGTFQKIFSQEEMVAYLSACLDVRVHVAALGIAYVFRDSEEESRFVANRAFSRRLGYRHDLIETFAKDAAARRLVRRTNELGRVPRADEFAGLARLADTFGSISIVTRLCLRAIDPAAFEGSRQERRADLVTYLAALRLEGVHLPSFRSLPSEVQPDIKEFWPNYRLACAEAERFLFRIGSADEVRAACTSSVVGKLLPSHLYVHRSAEDELPPLLRLIVVTARRVIGTTEHDLIKIACDGRAVSFLLYRDFEGDAHPQLLRSVRVYLPRASFQIRDYSASESPPILHRKDAFVMPSYPGFGEFRSLTAAEEAAGLLSSPDIGNLGPWLQLLVSRGIEIVGHQLVGG